MEAIKKIFEIDLDVKRSTTSKITNKVKQGDNGNIFLVNLTHDGEPIDLAGTKVLAVFSNKNGTAQQDTDGHGITFDAEQTNRITIELYTTSFAPGLVECEVQILSGESYETLITSAKFNFECERAIMNDETIQATPEYPVLAKLTASVEETIKKLEPIERNEDERIANEEAREQAEEAREQAWTTATAKATTVEYNRPVSATAEKTADGINFDFKIPRGAPAKEIVIKQSVINDRGHLMLTYNDSTTVDAGYAKGVLVTDTIPTDKKPDILLLTNAKPVSPFITAFATLTVAGWTVQSEGNFPYVQVVEIADLPANADGGEVQLTEAPTQEQYEAAASCGVQKIQQKEGVIVCGAYELPEVDLPIQVRWWQGAVEYAAE